MSFCKYCGKALSDGENCACRDEKPLMRAMDGEDAVVEQDSLEKYAPSKKKVFVVLGLILTILIISIFIKNLNSFSPPKKYEAALEQMVAGLNECDLEKTITAMYPDDIIEMKKEEMGHEAWEVYLAEENEELSIIIDEYLEDRYGRDIVFSVDYRYDLKPNANQMEKAESYYTASNDTIEEIYYSNRISLHIQGKRKEAKVECDGCVVRFKDSGWKICLFSDLEDLFWELASKYE